MKTAEEYFSEFPDFATLDWHSQWSLTRMYNDIVENLNKEVVVFLEENKELKKELDGYKALDSHYEEIEEDAKVIAKENAELKETNKVERENAVTRLFQNQRLEKENKSLDERVLQLEKDKGKLNDENRELKAKVEEYEEMLKYLQ